MADYCGFCAYDDHLGDVMATSAVQVHGHVIEAACEQHAVDVDELAGALRDLLNAGPDVSLAFGNDYRLTRYADARARGWRALNGGDGW